VDPLLAALLVAMNPQLYLLHAGIPRMNMVAQAESVTIFDGEFIEWHEARVPFAAKP
jgi:hypothetical protein